MPPVTLVTIKDPVGPAHVADDVVPAKAVGPATLAMFVVVE